MSIWDDLDILIHEEAATEGEALSLTMKIRNFLNNSKQYPYKGLTEKERKILNLWTKLNSSHFLSIGSSLPAHLVKQAKLHK